jgi:hypothetical protein
LHVFARAFEKLPERTERPAAVRRRAGGGDELPAPVDDGERHPPSPGMNTQVTTHSVKDTRSRGAVNMKSPAVA